MPWAGPSGASAHLRAIAGALKECGDDVHVEVARWSDERGSVEDLVDVPVTVGVRWRLRRPSRVWERHSLAGGWHVPDVLEVNAPLAIERRGLRGAALERAIRRPDRVLRRELRLWRRARRLVVVSSWLRDYALTHGCDPERVRVVANGSSADRPGDRDGTRRRLGVDGLVVGFVGSMKPWHGLDLLPPLLDELGATGIVAGVGPVPEHPRLRPLGFVGRDLPDVLAACDVLVAPYTAEAPPWLCPLKVVDALAQGVPVVASDVGDCRVLLAAGGGEVLTERTPEAWAAAVRRAVASPRLARPRPWRHVVEDAIGGIP